MKAERPLITAGAKRGSVAVIDRFAKVSDTALLAAGWMTSIRKRVASSGASRQAHAEVVRPSRRASLP